MAKFFYIARDKSGTRKSGVEEAGSKEDVISRLQAQEMIVVNVFADTKEGRAMSVEEAGKSRVRARHGRIASEDLTLFCRQLATLLGAGVTILKCLDIISQQVASRGLYQIITDLEKKMEAGYSLHEAMSKHPKAFSELWVNLIESGEASGNLAMVLNRLATYLERNAAFKKKIISALIYPALLFVAGTGALLFMTIKIIPTFGELFKGFGVSLPPLTAGLMAVSGFLQKYWIHIGIGITVGVILLQRYIKTPVGRRSYEKFLFSLPLFGDFYRSFVVERFTSEMSTLVESGVPILYSLEIAEHSVGSFTLGDIIRHIKEEVREGKTLSQPMDRSGFFDPMAVQMVMIGEEIGELSNMFKRLNAFYQESIDTFLTRFASMFEPIMLLFMGFVIGVMVIGMFLPIFQITQIR